MSNYIKSMLVFFIASYGIYVQAMWLEGSERHTPRESVPLYASLSADAYHPVSPVYVKQQESCARRYGTPLLVAANVVALSAVGYALYEVYTKGSEVSGMIDAARPQLEALQGGLTELVDTFGDLRILLDSCPAGRTYLKNTTPKILSMLAQICNCTLGG